ncbi:MAG: hypothetical protein QM813_11190 [Verrucomicrobiota bacterium]
MKSNTVHREEIGPIAAAPIIAGAHDPKNAPEVLISVAAEIVCGVCQLMLAAEAVIAKIAVKDAPNSAVFKVELGCVFMRKGCVS